MTHTKAGLMWARHALLKVALASVSLVPALTLPLRADTGERVSGIADQQQVNVTIYNGSMALVHDRRHLVLEAGDNHIAWRDVSANMDATSAILSDLTTPGAVNVVEQNFNFDLLKPSTVLDKYVGRQVTVVHPHPAAGQPARETATLLSDNEGVVLQYADRVETTVQDGYIVYPSIPADLRDRPTLVLDVASDHAGAQTLDLAYLTGGLSWAANYVGVVAPDEKHMDLNGLVTLANTSGTTFKDAHMQLVAGNVNMAAPPMITDSYTVNAPAPTPPPQFSQENYFEYHLYTLQRTTTIGNNQTKQVALLGAHNVPITKTLELRGSESYYESSEADLGTNLKVGVYITFVNKNGDLGIPLPGGTVRLYKNDTRGTSQFLGADAIDHTPRNEDVRLHLGDSFDVTANKKQTDFHGNNNCSFDSSYTVLVKNAKSEPVNVLVVEPLPGDWTIPAENIRHVKSSSSTATWTVHVPADSKTKLTYTAHIKVCI